MKTIIILLSTIILNACGTSKSATNSTEVATNIEAEKTMQDPIKIEYRAHARGSFKKIILENKSISVQNHHSEDPTIKACPDKEWNDLIDMVSTINLKAMSTFEAPSKAHQYDGAPIASFIITKDGTVYDVPAFDAGKPNKNIEPIVNMVINIAE